MKAFANLELIVILLALAPGAWAQGTVNFANATSAYGTTVPDHLLRWGLAELAGTLVASNSGGMNFTSLRAQLFYGASTINTPGSLVSVTDAPASFRASTSANAGAWLGGTRTLFGFQPGDTVMLNVIVWDSSQTSDPLQGMFFGLFGTSGLFPYTIPAAGSPPTAYLPANQLPFLVGMPEPGTMALTALGVVVWLVLSRRK